MNAAHPLSSILKKSCMAKHLYQAHFRSQTTTTQEDKLGKRERSSQMKSGDSTLTVTTQEVQNIPFKINKYIYIRYIHTEMLMIS